MSTLVIVESPGKLKKIRAILGAGFKVEASVGHVRDLPQNDMGVAAPDFKPHYEKTTRGKDVLKKLKSAVEASDAVLLATDPDREGEAIAWHLADALKLKKPQRITFQAIEEKPVKAAMAAPRPIDMQLVHAQEARRVLDRLVGYTVSPVLSAQAGQKLSAGRVQSPAVRLVVERERAIKAFKPTQHYGVLLHFTAESGAHWTAAWDTKPHLADGQEYFTDATFAERVGASAVKVASFEDSQSKAAPPAPFTTSMLQQAAQVALKFKPKTTMDLAQKLYEQGAITYHRTDAPNMSDDGYQQLASFASAEGLKLGAKKRTWKSKDGAQEAHEAIRPTHFEQREAGETEQEKALYRLIWSRAVACQMPEAIYAVRTAVLDALEPVDDQPVRFVGRGKTLIEPGWKALYDDAVDSDAAEADDTDNADNPVPELAIGDTPAVDRAELKTKTTKAPARYKEGTLVKELERLGIGRPSTYAAILGNIAQRNYIAEDAKGFLSALPAGETIVDALVGKCQFVELDYTRELEDQLDAIAQGKSTYLPVVSAAHQQLAGELGGFVPAVDENAHPCPECGKAMRQRTGKSGAFWGCSGYPDCKVTLPDVDGAPGERKAPVQASSQHACKACGKPLAHRQGTGAKGAYDFWGCTGFPKCKTTYKSDSNGNPAYPTET